MILKLTRILQACRVVDPSFQLAEMWNESFMALQIIYRIIWFTGHWNCNWTSFASSALHLNLSSKRFIASFIVVAFGTAITLDFHLSGLKLHRYNINKSLLSWKQFYVAQISRHSFSSLLNLLTVKTFGTEILPQMINLESLLYFKWGSSLSL